ncbi:nitrate reductase [Reinekea thalattae]|uniref:Nitrate reductase n=1 Tax=Reinekea thalattae TaxID=2593301 RepID=A0A5C8Z5M1_9GAMM|nr:nitrate reductase [Reinekea thalattae]
MKSTCPYCGVGCGVLAKPVNDSVSVQGDAEHPANAGKLCIKGSQLSSTLTSHGRLQAPVVENQQTSWTQALDYVAEKFRQSIEQYGPDSVAFYLSGQILSEDYYVANKLMKGFIGSANVDTNSRLCMSSAVAAYKRAFGSDTVPNSYDDLEETDLMILIGSNAAWTHPILYQRMRAAQKKNPHYKMVVIDPKRSATAGEADLHLAIKPGTDAMLYNGLLAYLARVGKLDQTFINQHTNNFEQALEACPQTLTEVALFCGISENKLRQFYDWFANAKRSISFYSMGINQSNSGTDKCNAIINVHLASGQIGKPGCGPYSITGQPNAMGGREVGGLANTLAAHMEFDATGIDKVSRFWRSNNIAKAPGLKALDMFEAVEQDKIKVLWVIGTNPAVSLPDSDRIKRILQQCECLIVSDCMAETDTTQYADVLLPATGWGEKNGTVTNADRTISRQRGFIQPLGQARHDWWIISEVAKRLGYGDAFQYEHAYEIFREHAQLSGFENNGSRDFDISAFSNITQQQYDSLKPIQWPVNETYPSGKARMFDDQQFFTADKKANFIAITPKLPELNAADKNSLILNNGRGRDQWHTMTRTSAAKKLNSHELYPSVLINPLDAKKLSIMANDLVKIANKNSNTLAIAKLSTSQSPGECYMSIHWNQQFANKTKANNLTQFIADPVSGQPQYKQNRVQAQAVTTKRWLALFSQQAISLNHNDNFSVSIEVNRGYFYLQALSESMLESECLSLLPNVEKQLQYRRPNQDEYRITGIVDSQIDYIVSVSEQSPIPALDALMRMFEQGQCNSELENELMSKSIDVIGQRVCSCFNVYHSDISDYLKQHPEASQSELQRELRCGSNCGSCRPEIADIVSHWQADVKVAENL